MEIPRKFENILLLGFLHVEDIKQAKVSIGKVSELRTTAMNPAFW